jgi:hypothetical protein
VNSSAPAAPSQPAAPAPSAPIKQVQLFLAIAGKLSSLPAASSSASFFSVSSSLTLGPIPIYERDCTYLI